MNIDDMAGFLGQTDHIKLRAVITTQGIRIEARLGGDAAHGMTITEALTELAKELEDRR